MSQGPRPRLYSTHQGQACSYGSQPSPPVESLRANEPPLLPNRCRHHPQRSGEAHQGCRQAAASSSQTAGSPEPPHQPADLAAGGIASPPSAAHQVVDRLLDKTEGTCHSISPDITAEPLVLQYAEEQLRQLQFLATTSSDVTDQPEEAPLRDVGCPECGKCN